TVVQTATESDPAPKTGRDLSPGRRGATPSSSRLVLARDHRQRHRSYLRARGDRSGDFSNPRDAWLPLPDGERSHRLGCHPPQGVGRPPYRQGAPLYIHQLDTSSLLGARRGLRVCHIVSGDLWAGAEVQVATVASYLVERPDVNLSAVLLNEGRLASELRRLGVQVTVIDESRNSAVRIVALLTRYLREHHVEVVHTHRYKESVVGSIAAKLAGVPHVIRTVHGMPEPMRGWDRVKAWAYGAVDRATLWWFADLIIAVSKRMAETLKDSGYAPTPVTHIHNGVDPRKVRSTATR